MVPISKASLGKDWLKSLRVMSYIKVFATRNVRPARRTRLITYIHMILTRIKNQKKKKKKHTHTHTKKNQTNSVPTLTPNKRTKQ